MKPWLLTLPILLAGCADLPRDPDGTLDRITREGAMRVGVVADASGLGRDATGRLLARLSQRTSARPGIEMGAAEPLLQRLEDGRLDLVVAPFDPKSPWATLVSLSPPIAAAGSNDQRIEVRAAMRNGENRWIMLVESAARAAADPGAGE